MASHSSEQARPSRPPGFSAYEAWINALGLYSPDLRRVRRGLIVIGTLSLLTGAVALIVPAAASVGTSIFIGWVLVFSGIVMAGHAFSERPSGAQWVFRTLNALVSLVVGIYVLAFPLSGTITLTFALAVWFFAIGISELLAAIEVRRRSAGAVYVFLNGTVSVVLGALIVADLPSSAAWAIGLLVGINLIFLGTRALLVASTLGHALKD